jgi:hypothetical protein
MARKSIVVVVLVLIVAAASAWAQNRRDPTATTTAPMVISGENIGVRLASGADGDRPVRGTLVVKINGRWIDVVSPTVIVGAVK